MVANGPRNKVATLKMPVLQRPYLNMFGTLLLSRYKLVYAYPNALVCCLKVDPKSSLGSCQVANYPSAMWGLPSNYHDMGAGIDSFTGRFIMFSIWQQQSRPATMQLLPIIGGSFSWVSSKRRPFLLCGLSIRTSLFWKLPCGNRDTHSKWPRPMELCMALTPSGAQPKGSHGGLPREFKYPSIEVLGPKHYAQSSKLPKAGPIHVH